MRRWSSEQDTWFIADHHCSLPGTKPQKGTAIKYNWETTVLGKDGGMNLMPLCPAINRQNWASRESGNGLTSELCIGLAVVWMWCECVCLTVAHVLETCTTVRQC